MQPNIHQEKTKQKRMWYIHMCNKEINLAHKEVWPLSLASGRPISPWHAKPERSGFVFLWALGHQRV